MNVQAGGISEALPLTTVNLDKQARIPRPRLLVNRPQSHWAAVPDAQSDFRNAGKQEFSLQATHEPFLPHGNPKADLLTDLSQWVTAGLIRPR
ncbi:hypothetical protein [Amycolatopsis nivea]|uniref:hypothetical protein n=1 Tax=Amycolatopsis nivea TaxID=1644109 RepID=UPI00106F5384|nr:hypothetical protein [Amycolatopsis nivea]